MSKTTKKVLLLLLLVVVIAVLPLILNRNAEFGGSDDAGSEIESLIFCLQTGIGVGVFAFFMGRFVERRKWMRDDD